MRALLLSDIHSNLEALTAVLEGCRAIRRTLESGRRRRLWRRSNQVIEKIRPLATLNVRGNHDRVCGGLTSSLGFNAGGCARAALWTYNELTPENLAWLNAMPQGPVQPTQPDISCAHGSPLDEDRYILSVRDAWAPLQR